MLLAGLVGGSFAMLYGITIIVILLAVSGAIAYIGDYLGRRIGKKKVSVFGLRPKHTSILITIVTGVMITFTTLAVILLVSITARESFFGLQRIKKEYKATKAALESKSAEFAKVKTGYEKKSAEYRDKEAKLTAALEDRQEELDALLGQINEKQVALRGLEKENAKLERGVKGMKVQIATLGAEKGRLVARNARLEMESKELVARKGALEREISNMAVKMMDSQKIGLYGEVIYQRNQPLARMILDKGLSKEEFANNMKEAIKVLRDAAVEKGAVIAQDAEMFHRFQIDKVWGVLETSRAGVVVEAVSATNVFIKDQQGEPFYVELKAYENRVAFRKGETVATGNVPSGATEEKVTEGLSKMISQVMELARSRGILPDLQTYMVGSMSQARFVEAVAALTDRKDGAVVELFAVSDTRISEKLQIDFRIK